MRGAYVGLGLKGRLGGVKCTRRGEGKTLRIFADSGVGWVVDGSTPDADSAVDVGGG